jgi:hypothetical protein
MTKKKPVGIVVRRGALRRFDVLTRKTADLPVAVSWDRRTEHRRTSVESASAERRSADRRQEPPFTWDAADFVVVGTPPEPVAATTPRKTRKKA